MQEELIVEGFFVRRLFQRAIRQKLIDRLTECGFADIGKNGTPFSSERAKFLVAKVENDDIMLAAETVGLVGDNDGFWSRIQNLLDWVSDHREQIMVVVKMLLSLILMFI